ncbi:MAG: hypothetical protein GY882_01945 [Actinomycetia bacterium]|nr:hypothetical protein [Actinomycetes bacterium]MCP4845024.1 hypothetical protein [Actinomycetes bacterium]
MRKSHEQLREEYAEFEDAGEWMVLELCEYFGAIDADAQAALFDLLEADCELITATNYGPGETTCFEIGVWRDGERANITAFTEAPPALGMFNILTLTCEAGDEIRIRHERAGLDTVEMAAQWPFDLTEVARLVSPAPDQVDDFDAALAALMADID